MACCVVSYLARVARKVDNPIHQTKHYPAKGQVTEHTTVKWSIGETAIAETITERKENLFDVHLVFQSRTIAMRP